MKKINFINKSKLSKQLLEAIIYQIFGGWRNFERKTMIISEIEKEWSSYPVVEKFFKTQRGEIMKYIKDLSLDMGMSMFEILKNIDRLYTRTITSDEISFALFTHDESYKMQVIRLNVCWYIIEIACQDYLELVNS